MPIYSVQGPDGRIYDIEGPAGASDESIISALEQHLAAQPKPKTGVLAALGKGAESTLSQLRSGISGAFGSGEEAATAGLQRGEDINSKYADQVSLDKIKEAYEKRGLLSAAKEVAGQIPAAIAEQAPNLATSFGAARLGAMAGAPFGPVGAVVGGGLGAFAPSLIQQYGGNIERQAQEQKNRGEEVSINKRAAGAAAVPQAALDVAQAFIPFGGKLISKLTGIPEKAFFSKAAGQAEKIANERLMTTLAKGTATGALAEIPPEIAQQMLERAQAGLSLTDQDAMKEYGQTAYQIGLLGPLGAVGRLSEKSAARQELAAKQEAQSTPVPEAEAKEPLLALPAPAIQGTDVLPFTQGFNEAVRAGAVMGSTDTRRSAQPNALTTPAPDLNREMEGHDALKKNLEDVQSQLQAAATAGDTEAIKALHPQYVQLEQQVQNSAQNIEKLGGVTQTMAELETQSKAQLDTITNKIKSAQKKLADAAQLGDFGALPKLTEKLDELKQEYAALTDSFGKKRAVLEEKQSNQQQRGQNRELFTQEEAPPSPSEKPAGYDQHKPVQGLAATPAEAQATEAPKTAAPTEVVKEEKVATPESTAAAEKMYAEIQDLEGQVERLRGKEVPANADKIAKLNTLKAQYADATKPASLDKKSIDLFSEQNLLNTAIQNNDQQTLDKMVGLKQQERRKTELEKRDADLAERDRLLKSLDERLGLAGQKVERTATPEEYDQIMAQIDVHKRAIENPQGNAKKSILQQLYDLTAEHEALTAQLESGTATPTLREKAMHIGKGTQPAPRQMDASERFQVRRRIDTVARKYQHLVDTKVKPEREAIIALHQSLYKAKPAAAAEQVRAEKAAESERQVESTRRRNAEGEVVGAVMSREAKAAKRVNEGKVSKEAAKTEALEKLALDLGTASPEFEKMIAEQTRRLDTLKKKYGEGDKAVTAYQIEITNERNIKARELGRKTPEYKKALKEQSTKLATAVAATGPLTPATKRTQQETRKVNRAPKVLRVAGSAMSEKEIEREISEGTEAERKRLLRGVETESLELNKDIVAALEQGDVRKALDLLSKDKNADSFSRAVAERLAPFLDVTKVNIANDLRAPDGKEVLGAATSKLIELNRNGGLSVETLLHESTHAAVERIVQLAESSPDSLTKEQRIAINELKALHAQVKKDAGITSKNAKSSLSEFVAEVMSNRNLQKQLAQRKWRMSNMWQGIKSIFMTMLGLKKVETMFGASVVSVEQLFVPASAQVGAGQAEQRVTRKLSAKDIAALHTGSNSMKQFADQFGPLIKQKDRTPEDAERIADEQIDAMLASVRPYTRRDAEGRLMPVLRRDLKEAADAAHNAKSVVALPTADTLDYKGMVTMSDGKMYDENNPLHYVEASPATFAALQAMDNSTLREREAKAIAAKRREDFQSLGDYLQANYKNYTTVEMALVLKAAAKYAVLSDKNGRLKLAEIGKDNRHNIAVVGKEAVDAVIEQLRAGKGLKQAFLDGLQKNADESVQTNERKNGWKKFDQVEAQGYLPNLYTEEEVNAAIKQSHLTDEDFEESAMDKESIIEYLIENGYLPDRQTSSEEAAVALNAGCAGTPWCTGASVSTARSQIEGGDFYVYYNKGRPEVAVRMDGTDKIGEIRGNNPNQALNDEQQQTAEAFLRSQSFKDTDKYLSEFERKKSLIKRAKGEAPFKTTDLFDAKQIVNTKGEIDNYSMERLLEFRIIDGYGNRPEPTDAVVNYFGKQYVEAIRRAYENQEYIFDDIDAREASRPEGDEVEFAGKKYPVHAATIKAAKAITVSFRWRDDTAAPVEFPKLEYLDNVSMFKGTATMPALKSVNEVVFYSEKNENVVSKLVLAPDTVVKEVFGTQRDTVGTIAGPTTIQTVTLRRGLRGLVLDLPDTKYAKVVDGSRRHIASDVSGEITGDLDRALDDKGWSYTRIRAAVRGAVTSTVSEKDIQEYREIVAPFFDKFFDSVKDVFGYNTLNHLENDTYVQEKIDAYDYGAAVRYAADDILSFNEKNPEEAFDKLLQVGEKTTGKKIEVPRAELIAPKLVGNPPFESTFTEAPEERRFSPKDVGVQKDKDGVFSFMRKPTQSSSVVAQEPGIVDNVLGNIMGLAGRVQYVDQYAALEAVTKKGLSAGQISSLEATNANYLLRFGQQRSQFAGQFLTNGPVKAEITKKAGGTETLYRSTKGTSMLDVATALNKAKLSDDVEQENMFTLYLAGKRASQVGWEKLNFKNPSQAKAEYDAVMARLRLNDTANAAFKEAAELYQKYNAGLLDFLVDTGALSSKKASELKSISYVPFYRINGNGEVQLMIDKEHPVRIANIKDQPQLKELVGGNTAILPVFTSAAQNTFMLTGMGLRNQAVKETSFMLHKLGVASVIRPGSGPQGTNVIRFQKNGENHFAIIDTDMYGVPAELIVRGMEGIKTSIPAVIKAMGIPANLLRAFVVRNPAYALRQVVRDPLNAWLTTGTDATPVLSSMKELAQMVAGRSEAERKLMETGAISSNVYSGDERDMAKFLKDMAAGKSGWDKAMSKLDAFALQGDSATRAVIYKDSLAKGMSEQEALLRTLESMNFSRRGVSPSMQALSIMIPFFNAQIQGLDVLYRAFKGDMPYSEQLKIREKLVTRGLLLAAGTMAYVAMMSDDEAYKRAKPEERYGNWFVHVPGFDEPVRVPIPFELGYLFKALPEAVLNMAADDSRADNAVSGYFKLVAQTNPFSLPQAVKPLTEVVLGKSFFGGDIESKREKDLLPADRYRAESTELAKLIGSVTASSAVKSLTGKEGLTPIDIDYLIRGYTGGLGIGLIQLANPLLNTEMSADVAKPTLKASKMPLIGGLFQPVEGRGTLDQAYNVMTEIQQTKGTLNRMIEQGKQAEARAFAQENADMLAATSVSGAVQQRLGELAKRRRQIEASPTMTTEQKDAMLKRIDQAQTELATQFLRRADKTTRQ